MRIIHIAVAAILLAAVLVSTSVNAQGDPRSNVNLIGMTPDANDFPDTRYRQQNEPACAIRPDDSACMICAYNDYRGVDLDIGFGDSWQGVSQSCDAGDTWRSRLAPGYPGDFDAEMIPAEFAADPRLAAIPGMAIFNFIAGYRDSNVGVLAIQHWLEVNKEDSDHYEPGRQTYFADEGTSGRFLDKPDMLAVLDPPGKQGVISIATEMENTELGVDGVITRDYPTGKLYVAYAAFTGSNSIKVLVKVSDDWGRSWQNRSIKLSEDQNQVSGISLTAIGGKVLAVWRRKGDGNDVDSIMYSIISNGGKKATKGEVLADVCAFDQPTLTGSETDFDVVTFRTNDFPWTANDGENFYVFYSDRARDPGTQECLTDLEGNPNGNPSIVMHHSTLAGNPSWTDFGPIDSTTTAATFQFMPTAFGANGKVQVAWYDTRRDPSDPAALPLVADYNAGSFLVNRTVDVFTTNVTIDSGTVTIPDPVRASQFSILVDEESDVEDATQYETEASFANKKLFAQGNAPFLGDYIAMAARQFRRNSDDTLWESNASKVAGANEDFFVAWTDNRDVTGTIAQITDSLDYSYDAEVSANASDAQSENEAGSRQLVADSVQDSGPPRDTTQTAEGIDGSDTNTPGFCVPETSRSRDANIYGSLIKDQARFYAVNPSKPLSGLQRAFPVVITNSDELVSNTYDLTITPGVCSVGNCQASFRQHPIFGSPELYEQVTVTPKSSIARTVFVAGEQSPVKIEARDSTTGDLLATIQLANAPLLDPENCLAAQQADPTVNCSVAENELHNLELKTINVHLLDQLTPGNELDAIPELISGDSGIDASILVPWAIAGGCCVGEDPASLGSVIEYAVENLADESTNLQNPSDPTNANLLNANLLNAALLNANLLNANLLNANLLNANLLNANLLNNSPTDLTDLGGASSELVTTAVNGGCCYIEAEPTVGSIIVWVVNNPEILNASLLNANLLNTALLNANLLNANLLNANLLNANLLNANLLNANLLNANLLNANLLNANLLNASLLNADLLNANLLNPTLVAQAVDGGCCVDQNGDPVPLESAAAVDVIIYAVGHPEVINASLLNAALLNANLLNANLLNANLLNANLLNANLLNANLLNANLLNANLLNADLLNANLLNANLLNANLLNAAIADGETVTFDDYTYPVTNTGNVTTAIDADVTINAPMVTVGGEEVMDVIATKLITWTANATPTVVDCVETVQLNTRVQSIAAPDDSFDVADIDDPFAGQTSAVVAAGETVFVTMRVLGTPAQLKAVRISGFTVSSQAANCIDTANGPQCATQLNEGIEQITFQDTTPPSAPVVTDISAEATSPAGATINWSYYATDAEQSNPILADCESVSLPALSSGSIFPLGDTPVSCTATDFAGNTSESADFVVSVTDTTPPEIVVNDGGEPIVFTANGPEGAWVDLTDIVTASDLGQPIDVSCITITPSTLVGIPLPDLLPPGDYTVLCSASDGSSVEVQVTITIDVVDIEPPVLTVPSIAVLADADPTTATAEVNYSTLVTATDNIAATVTIVCDPPSGSTFPIGDTTVTCTASDDGPNAAGVANSVTDIFVVTVDDATAPVITLTGSDITLQEDVDSYTEQGATVFDAGDPDVEIVIGGDVVDPTTTGTYVVTYDATDVAGNLAIQVTRTVTVEDSIAPIITLIGSNITLEEGIDSYTELGANVFDAGDPGIALIIGGDIVDTDTSGAYVVTYNAIDLTGLAAAQVTRTVTVRDSIAPVISLTGPATITLEEGVDSYTEQGAIVFDAGDTSVTINIGGDTVNTDTADTYIVTYGATDASGNSTDQITRTITVQDTIAPIITVPTQPLVISSDVSPVEVNYTDLVSVTVADAGSPGTTATCVPSSGDELPWGDTVVTCNANDGFNDADSAEFTVTVRFPYDIKIVQPKRSAKAGSTIPLDWQYLDWSTGAAIDSSDFAVEVIWTKMQDSACLLRDMSSPVGTSGPGDDSGNSDFRYSDSGDSWQYSWQTPEQDGYHKVSITPPGPDTENAWKCVRLR